MNNTDRMVNNSSVNEIGICTACGKKAGYKCDRCEDFYCSEECQVKDWRRHRYICIPMPNLVKAGQCPTVENNRPKKEGQSHQDKNSSNIQDIIPNGSCVFLMAFKSTNRCFIRSTNPSALAEREKILNEIHDSGMKSPAFSEKTKNISSAMALRFGKWCRVYILGRNNDTYRAMFTDFGDLANFTLKEMRRLPATILNLPSTIYMVTLKGITKVCTNRNGTLEKYTNKEYKIQYVKSSNGGEFVVELFQWGTSISLNSLINSASNDIDHQSVASSSSTSEISKAQLSVKKENGNRKQNTHGASTSNPAVNGKVEKGNKESENESAQRTNISNGVKSTNYENKKVSAVPRQIQTQKPCLEPPFETISITENDGKGPILILDNSYLESGYIGCLLENDCDNFKSVADFLNQYNVGDQPYKPKFGEYCLAKFENVWYRAKVIEILSEDKFLVVYIDFTNEKAISSDIIRRYPMSLTNPCCTTLCCIDGLPDDISDELKQHLEKILPPFSILNVDSIRMKEDNICCLRSNELLKKLHDLNLL